MPYAVYVPAVFCCTFHALIYFNIESVEKYSDFCYMVWWHIGHWSILDNGVKKLWLLRDYFPKY